MNQTLIIFSGLPGTGKSTLATQVARALQIPIIRIDDATGNVPPNAGINFWDGQIEIVLALAEAQLELGLSVVIDSVFMAYDRHHAQALAQKYQTAFHPIYTFVSDEALWEERVTKRIEQLNHEAVATWDGIQHQRQHFLHWQPGTALFVDGVNSIEQNLASVLEFVTRANVNLISLSSAVPLTKGKYHLQSPK